MMIYHGQYAPISAGNDYSYIVKVGMEYVTAACDGAEHKLTESKNEAFQWPAFGLADSYAEQLEGRVHKRFSDGYEQAVGANYHHP